MFEQTMLNDKFTAARLPRLCLSRPRVNDLFNQASNKQVIFVSAPAGYGKTVSARQWLSQTGLKTIWIGLDGYDNTPSVFYKLFCTGILSVQPDNKMLSDICRSPQFSLSPVEHTIQLLSEFTPDHRQYALVLDDMHLITNSEIKKSGLSVRKRLPFSFVTVILTRNEISDEYLEKLNEDCYAHIKSGELAFTGEEIRSYFKLHGLSITKQEADQVREATDGWAMGVNALALSGRTEPGRHAAQILSKYIKHQVWAKWDESLRLFLMQTAVADEVPVALCEQLTGRADSGDLLETLCTANAFVARASEDVYTYHQLFSDFLRTQADEYGIDWTPLCKTTAYYYVEQSMYLVAWRYAVRSEDHDIMLRVVNYLFRYHDVSMDEFVQYARVYENEEPPERVYEQAPFLYAMPIWEHYLRANAVKMEYYMDKLYAHLPVIARDFASFYETALTITLLDYRVTLPGILSKIDKRYAAQSNTRPSQNSMLICEMPFIHRSTRDYSELADATLFNDAWRLLTPLYGEDSELIQAAMKSGLMMEMGRRNEALAAALQAKDLITDNTRDDLRFSVYAHVAAVYYTMKSKVYNAAISEAERFVERNDIVALRPNLLAFKTRIALLNGDRDAAKAWLDNYFVVENEPFELHKLYQYFTTARAYIVLGKMDTAWHYIIALNRLVCAFNRPLDIAETDVLRSIMEWHSHQKAEAQASLESVLVRMCPYGFIRVVAMEGAAVLPILKRLKDKTSKPEYTGPLDAHYLHKVIYSTYDQATHYKGIVAHINDKPIKLTRQQKHMLTLLAQGYSYKEIMEETTLTIHTVKSHIAAAYDKLGAHTAQEASAKARELGFI